MLKASKDLNTVWEARPAPAKAVWESRLSARSVVYAPFGLSANHPLEPLPVL